MNHVLISTEEAKKASIDELLQQLSASEKGLSSPEADQRLQQYGPNKIVEKKRNPVLKFFTYFWGPIPWMIEVAAILSIIIQHYKDFWIIIALFCYY